MSVLTKEEKAACVDELTASIRAQFAALVEQIDSVASAYEEDGRKTERTRIVTRLLKRADENGGHAQEELRAVANELLREAAR